jgi:hypothetical protein
MEQEPPKRIDIEQHLARLAPPSIPLEAWTRDNVNVRAARTWNRSFCVSALAGLMTEPTLHANGIRLDWLQRLVFAKASGERKPKPSELSRALNFGLEKARVLRLEDPVEDLFCDLIVSRHGNFRIFTGRWETPGPYTQTLLDAFEALLPAPQKDAALNAVYAILRLSDELARRANVDRLTPSGGEPAAVIDLPDADALKGLAARVRFRNDDLAGLGIDRQSLSPFVLEAHHFSYIGTAEPGDSPLEFYPLLQDSSGITVASPPGISTAVRAALVDVAKRGGLEDLLLSHLLIEQEHYSEGTGFWPALKIRLGAPDQHFLRSAVLQSSEGRHLQIIQVPVTFDQFPQKAFASVRRMTSEVNHALAKKVSVFWDHVRQQPNVRDSTTVLLLSGWGTPHLIKPSIEHAKAPAGWRFMGVSFADVVTLGACENGKFYSVRRILDQVEQLEADGFSFQNLNGLLNLFGFWRSTKGNLIPEHLREIEPPCNLVLPTDELLAPRIEAATKRDYRALPFTDGTFKKVLREDWDNLQPVYGSLTDLEQGRLVGAVWIEDRPWWIESVDEGGASTEGRYRTWQAVLQWLTAVGPAVIQHFPAAFPRNPSAASINTPSMSAFEAIRSQGSVVTDLAGSVSISRVHGTAKVVLAPDWLAHVQKRENDAEVELVAAVLDALQAPVPEMVSRDALRSVVRTAIASTDWRWMHAQEAFTPLERLARSRLVERFTEIPLSAFALAKCRSIWQFRDRSEGAEITGENDCRAFLAQYREHILNTLISRVQRFNRDKLLISAAAWYQSARYEQSHWRFAIRAMRAIRGAAADQSAFQRQNAINAVQRAAKSIMEIGACEASRSADVAADQHDLENLFAIALLLFGNGQLFASIRAGLVQPTLRISPAGDLLTDRSALETALMPAARLATTKTLNEAGDAYGRVRPMQEPSSGGRRPIDDDLRTAIEAEYKATAEAFVDLQYAILQIAEARESGVLLMKRSELVRELRANKYYTSQAPAAMLERLTLLSRNGWNDLSAGLTEGDLDLGRFDRPYSLINRPLLALETGDDPLLLVSPILVSDSTMYALSGLRDGNLQNQFWTSKEAKSYVGMRSNEAGLAFEERITEKLRNLGLRAWTRVKLSWILNTKVDPMLGDIDVLAVSSDNRRLWVIEAKDLRFCRTEAEVSARLSEYRGRMVTDAKNRDKPDKMLRHIKRVQYLRARNDAVCSRLDLNAPPEVHGLLIVDSPQPMNFYMLDQLEDGQSAFLDAIHSVAF